MSQFGSSISNLNWEVPFPSTNMSARMYLRVVCFVALPLLLLWFAVKPGNMPCYNFVWETIGWPEIVLNRCILYQENRPEDEFPLIFADIARLYKSMGENDQSLEIYEREFVPWWKVLFEDSVVLHKNSNVPFNKVARIAGHISDLYRMKGEYQKSLDMLQQTRLIFLRCVMPSIPYWLQLYTLKEKIKHMRRLVHYKNWQNDYTAALVKAAHRSFLVTDVSHEANQVKECPALRSDRFCWYFFSSSLFGKTNYNHIQFLSFFVLSSWRWIRLVGIVLTGILVVIAQIWNQFSVIEQVNAIAKAMSMWSLPDIALKLYEKACCEILANPYEESILVSEVGLEIFIGVMLVYSDLHWDQKAFEMAETVRDLVNIRNTVFKRQDEPNDSAIASFRVMSNRYSLLGQKDLADAYEAFAEGRQRKKFGQTNSLATPSEPVRDFIMITTDHIKEPISQGEL